MQWSEEENLISLTYVSSAVRSLPQEEILEILRTARMNNQRLGITGMLLYQDGNFMQTLEGPTDAVANLLGRIESDARHRGIIRLLKKKVGRRSFENWSMAFQNLDALASEELQAVSPFLSGSLLDDSFRLRPENCYKLMLSFKANLL